MNAPRLCYALDGPPDAPVLVMSGSLGATRDMWLPQVTALIQEWQILRIDHPGHGQSPVWEGDVTVENIGRAVEDLLDAHGYEKVSWCGLSLGGAIGQWIAAHAPERVEYLILCCTAPRFDSATYLQRAATVREHGVASIAGAVVERWFTTPFREQRRDLVARYRAMLEEITTEGYAACAEAVAHFDARPYLARVAAPTLVLAGSEDPAITVEQARMLQDGIPGARLEMITDAAHLANVEQPEVVNAAIRAHLRGGKAADV